ncbi:methyltransferase [Photobacterium sp. GJ3]|uniref:tRNA1(Val) (adenine(37)-N6)-methyltransferase n=1 Tax=Photobacterium sp. GJ3 TaxID=2829502 RepID=UPI001B8B27CC|nr:methyltransferase [Photobacterium sp. GJ3]QUJ67979.1 methyltransferase [Photobacterium sp. GJ3]
MNKGFTLKKFHVDDHGCGMPVSTDGILLGAWAEIVQPSAALETQSPLLDIGCGSGLLALMAAQRSQADKFPVLALDIDAHAVCAARQNFEASPWAACLQAEQQDLLTWAPRQTAGTYSTIWCNPPYFNHGEQANCQRRATARHSTSLPHPALLRCLAHLLAPQGKASLILPASEGERLLAQISDYGLHCHRICRVRSTATKAVSRYLITVSPQPGCCEETELTLHEGGHYSPAFVELTRDFYLKF